MAVKTFKFFLRTHKWTGIILSVLLAMTAVTGFLLLVKKQVAWIQPPTMKGAAGEVEDFITNQRLFEVVLSHGHADFQAMDDIDRVDFRPDKRVFKVRSLHNNAEIQVDAITGDVLSIDVRRSDLIEQIHDGSFFAGWFHDWGMPVVALALLFLVFSGLWLWLEPVIRKARRRRRNAA